MLTHRPFLDKQFRASLPDEAWCRDADGNLIEAPRRRLSPEAPDAVFPEAGWVMLHTRMVNNWLGTSYTMEEVAEMPETVTDLITGLRGGLEPKPKDKGK